MRDDGGKEAEEGIWEGEGLRTGGKGKATWQLETPPLLPRCSVYSPPTKMKRGKTLHQFDLNAPHHCFLLTFFISHFLFNTPFFNTKDNKQIIKQISK